MAQLAPPTPHPVGRRVYPVCYLIAMPVCLALAAVLMAFATQPASKELIPFCWMPLVPAIVGTCMLLYKSWAAIQGGQTRTTPARAVGFSFIPFFNLYWLFQVWYGYAVDYNRFLDRHGIAAPRLSERLYLAYAIVALLAAIPFVNYVVGIPALVLLGCVVVENCRAINQLADPAVGRASPGAAAVAAPTPLSGLLIAAIAIGLVGLTAMSIGVIGLIDCCVDYQSSYSLHGYYEREETRLKGATDAKSLKRLQELAENKESCLQWRPRVRTQFLRWLGVFAIGGLIGAGSAAVYWRRRKLLQSG